MGGSQSAQLGGANPIDKFSRGGGRKSALDYQGAPPDVFAVMHEYLNAHRTRCLELFREFDKNRSGDLDRRELARMVLRLMPDVKRRDMRYFRAMCDLDGDGRITFKELNEVVKECKHAGALARTKQLMMEDLKYELRRLVKHSRREAVQIFNEFDRDRSGFLEHAEVVRMLRFLKPSITTSDLRFIMANLYIIDTDEDGRISIEELLGELGLMEGPTNQDYDQDYEEDIDVVDDIVEPEEPAPPPVPEPEPEPEPEYEPEPMYEPEPAPPPPPPPAPVPVPEPTYADDVSEPEVPSPMKNMAVQSMPKTAKEELRIAVKLHKEHEERLKETTRIAQECMATDADELRRDIRRLEEFSGELDNLAERISASGATIEDELKSGFQKIRAAIDERESALLSQVADVTAERLAVVRAQKERTNATEADAQKILSVAETALVEKDPYVVLAQSDKFETSLDDLRTSGRTQQLDAATTDDLGLFVDFEEADTELRGTLDFVKGFDGVPGALRGPAAMKTLKDVFGSISRGKDGKIDKSDLMNSLRRDQRIADLLKMPTSMSTDKATESFEDTFRRIDVHGSQQLSWPEFASYFGKSLYQSDKKPMHRSFSKSKAELVRDVERLSADLDTADMKAEEAARESTRYAKLLDKAESFATRQARLHEDRISALQDEKSVLQSEFDAKLKSVTEENAAKQADFEARLQMALERSEAVLRANKGEDSKTQVGVPNSAGTTRTSAGFRGSRTTTMKKNPTSSNRPSPAPTGTR